MMLLSHSLLQLKPIRAWLTNGIESIILPPFVCLVGLLIFLLLFYNFLKLCATQKKKWCAHLLEVGGADGMATRPLDSVCLSVDADVEQLPSRKQWIMDYFHSKEKTEMLINM